MIILSIKEILEHYRKLSGISITELGNAIGLSYSRLYVRYAQPGTWRLSELIDAYDFLQVPDEERRFQ